MPCSNNLFQRSWTQAVETCYSREIELIPISLPILETATQLRASTRIKTPDAIHAATALMSGCNIFITNDKGFRHIAVLNQL